MKLRVATAVLLAATCSCASVEFERDTPTSGSFRSTGMSFTLLSFDFPSRAIDIARGNASDASQPNTIVTEEWVFPYLGPLDWILDILSVRYARVSGTWGFPAATAGAAGATPGSTPGSSSPPGSSPGPSR